ncbi:matrixin family metalloprotease, partial [Thioclava sp. UBA3469]|uniref:matrixin family metalloprotease n=1 Tax=Thioclava sp. UBA3469 TaxID=1947693 RepID=UPI002580C175
MTKFLRRTRSDVQDAVGLANDTALHEADNTLHREENYRIEALEPRLLLSADPVFGELARVAATAHQIDPIEGLSALVQTVDDLHQQDELAADHDPEEGPQSDVAWPENWAHEPDVAPLEAVAEPAREQAAAQLETAAEQLHSGGFLTAVQVQQLLKTALSWLENMPHAGQDPIGSSVADLTGHEATGPPAAISNALENNEKTDNPDAGFVAAGSDETSENQGDSPAEEGAEPQYLHLDATADSTDTGAADLTEAQLAPLVQQALAQWASRTDAAILSQLTFTIADLEDGALARITGTLIEIDADAAGVGWFIDATPGDSTEFDLLAGDRLVATDGAASEGVDLFTVLLHEIGHALGLDHDADAAVMSATLGTGERIGLPDAAPSLGAPVAGAISEAGGALDGTADSNLTYTVNLDGTVTVNGVTYGTPGAPITSIAAGTGLSDTIEGPDAETVWTITGINEGSLSWNGLTITFTGVERLEGGTEADAFAIDGPGFVTAGFAGNAGLMEISVGDFVSLATSDGVGSPIGYSTNTGLDGVLYEVGTGTTTAVTAGFDVTTISLTSGSFFAGSGANGYFTLGQPSSSVGFAVDNLSFSITMIRETATDRQWVIANGAVDALGLVNVDNVTATLSNGTLELVTSQLTDPNDALSAKLVVSEIDSVATGATAPLAKVSGDVTLAIGGEVLIAGGFSFTKTIVSGLTGATDTIGDLMVFGFDAVKFFAGTGAVFDTSGPVTVDTTNAFGFSVTGFTGTFAVLSSGGTTYTGIDFSFANATPVGITGLTAEVSNVAVQVNTASGIATPLNWDQGALVDAGLTLNGALTKVEATATLIVSDAVYVSGTFALESSAKTGVTFNGASEGGDYFTLSIIGGRLFAGVGAEVSGGSYDLTNATGFEIPTLDLTLAMFTVTSAGANLGQKVTALELSTAATLHGITDVTATVDALDVTYASMAFDWSQVGGPSFSFDSTFTGFTIDVRAVFTVKSTVLLAGDISITVTKQTIAAADNPLGTDLTDAQVMTFALADGYIFVGSGGGFTTDGNSKVNGLTRDGDSKLVGTGFGAEGVLFEFASVKNVDGTTGAVLNAWSAIKLYVGTVEVAGIPGFTLAVSDFVVEVNAADAMVAVNPTVMTWKGLDLGAPLALTDATNGFDNTERFFIRATIDELNISDTVLLTGSFSVEKTAGTSVGGVTGDLLYITLTDLSLFAGAGATIGASGIDTTNAIGFSAAGGNFYIGILTTSDPIPVSYTGVSASLASLGLVNVEGVTLNLASLKVLYNSVSDTTLSNLDWSSLTGLEEVTDTVSLAVSGKLTLAVGDFVYLRAGFGLKAIDVTAQAGSTETLDLVDITTGTLTFVTLSDVEFFAGTGASTTTDEATGTTTLNLLGDAAGLHANGGNLALGLLTDTTTGVKYTGVIGSLSALEAKGIDAVQIKLSGMALASNSTTALTGPRLDWSTVNDTDVTTALGDLGPGDQLAVSGTLSVEISETVFALATFNFSASTETIDDTIQAAITDAQVTRLTLTNVNFFAGVGGAFDDANAPTAIADQGTGFLASGGTLELIVVKEKLGTATPHSWSALSLSVDYVGMRGLPNEFALGVTGLYFRMNTASMGATKLDWSAIVDPAENPGIAQINADTGIAFGGTLDLALDGFVLVYGTVEGSISTADIDDGVITLTAADITSFKITGAQIFVGAGGAFDRDATTNEVTGLLDQGTGIYASMALGDALEFAQVTRLGVLTDNAATNDNDPATQWDNETVTIGWTALRVTVASLGLRGIDAFQIALADLAVDGNFAAIDGTFLNWASLGGVTGLDTLSLADATDGLTRDDGFSVSGTVSELNVAGVIVASGKFGIKSFASDIIVPSGVTTETVLGANILIFTLSDLTLFAGVGGALLGDGTIDPDQGTGFVAENASLQLVLVKEDPLSVTLPAVPRSWTAVALDVATVRLQGLPNTVTVQGLDLYFGFNGADAVNGERIDWATTGVTEIANLASVDLFDVTEMSASFNIAFGGYVEFTVDGFVTVAGTMAGQIRTETLDDGNGLIVDGASVMTFALTGGYFFAGQGGVFTRTDGKITDVSTTEGTGIYANNVGIEFASVTQTADNPLTTGVVETRTVKSWSAILVTSQSVGVTGLTGFTLRISDVAVEANFGYTDPLNAANNSVMNWKGLDLGLTITDSTDGYDATAILSVTGTVSELNVAGVVIATGTFSIKSLLADVAVATAIDTDGTLTGAKVLIFTLSDLNFFAGVDGVLKNDGTIDPDQGMGFVAQGGSIELVMVSEDPATVTSPAVARSWMALSLRVDQLGLQGLPLTATVKDLYFAMNGADADGNKLDWGATGVDQINALADITNLDAGFGIEFGAYVELQIEGAILLAG